MSGDEGIEGVEKQTAVDMYRRMVEIREFEEKIRYLFLEGKMPGTIHQYIGMEACAAGVCASLREDDVIASTHRPHGHAIARGIPLREIMAELYGKKTGCCRGKGGSMHIGDLSRGMLPAIAIVGGNLPIVTGMALAFKLRQEKRVAVSFFGDGASNEGAFHEALNMAAVYQLPAVFVCENNQYGASTSIRRVTRIQNIADRAAAYGMRGDIADGMNVFSVYEHARKAVALAREGDGPTLLELKTFRFCGHSRRDPNNYMTKDEINEWKKRDPILLCRAVLADEGVLDESDIRRIGEETERAVAEAITFGQESPEPLPEDTLKDLFADREAPQ
jgi:TPP-dependent pyruvate/acetoin dehydrogenase alpha subunit